MAKLSRTNTPGIFRRHVADCGGDKACRCSYVVVWRHRGRQHKSTFRTYAEAREAQGKRQAGDRRPMSKVSFSDYFDGWIDSYEGRTSRGFSETSRHLYRNVVREYALPEWGSWKLAEVEHPDVRKLFAELRRRGKGRGTLRTLRAALSAMYATAIEDGLLVTNPIRGVRLPNAVEGEGGEEEKRAKALTREELQLLLAALPEDGHWRLLMEFMAVTGLRIGETIGLRWEHVDLGQEPKVKVREQVYRGKRKRLKSREGRRDVPLSAGMVDRLLTHRRDSYGGPKSPVFASTTGTELDPQNVRRTVLQPAALSLGWYVQIEGGDGKARKRTTLGFHSLRHTCASMLFERGRNVKQVQEWLGHARPSITLDVYAHLMDEGVGEGLDIEPQGNTGATQALRTGANQREADLAESVD